MRLNALTGGAVSLLFHHTPKIQQMVGKKSALNQDLLNGDFVFTIMAFSLAYEKGSWRKQEKAEKK